MLMHSEQKQYTEAEVSRYPAPWYQRFFDEAYLRIYTPFLPAEKTLWEVDQIASVLSLNSGDAVLDLCCGYGRHVLPLAQRGYHMTGQDLSPVLLSKAKADAHIIGTPVRWLQRDMRDIPFKNEFNAVTCLFSSFGYFDQDHENRQVLHQVYRALKAGGQFLLETFQQARVVKAYLPHNIVRYPDGLTVLEERKIDLPTGRLNVSLTMLFSDEKRTTYDQSIRIYVVTELEQMLKDIGFSVRYRFGGLDQSPLTLDSQRLVIVAQKEQPQRGEPYSMEKADRSPQGRRRE